MRARRPSPDLPSDDDDDLGASPGPNVYHWARLVLHAAWLRKRLAGAVFLAAACLVVAYYALAPPVYLVEAKVLAQRQLALPSVVRSVYEDQPTRSAWELIHRRENLVAIIRQAKLLPESSPPEPAAGPGAGERLQELLRGAGSGREESVEDVLVRVLDHQLIVAVADGTITIGIYWRDPQEAYDIVQAALQNFLEARHIQEVTSIDEVIAVLEGRTASLRAELERAVEESGGAPGRPARPAVPRVRQPSQELVRLQSMLEARQRAVQDVEDIRRRRLADLQAQLDQARTTLSDAHPAVISLRKDIDTLSRESPQIQSLREEETRVRQQWAARMAQEGFQGVVSVAPPAAAVPGERPEESQRVREARIQYEQMLARVTVAQVERDAARAAFKHRYNVIWPPQVPSEPEAPNPRKVLVLGGLAAVALGLLAGAAPDLLRGRILERWQIEQGLGLPVLGEVRRE